MSARDDEEMFDEWNETYEPDVFEYPPDKEYVRGARYSNVDELELALYNGATADPALLKGIIDKLRTPTLEKLAKAKESVFADQEWWERHFPAEEWDNMFSYFYQSRLGAIAYDLLNRTILVMEGSAIPREHIIAAQGKAVFTTKIVDEDKLITKTTVNVDLTKHRFLPVKKELMSQSILLQAIGTDFKQSKMEDGFRVTKEKGAAASFKMIPDQCDHFAAPTIFPKTATGYGNLFNTMFVGGKATIAKSVGRDRSVYVMQNAPPLPPIDMTELEDLRKPGLWVSTPAADPNNFLMMLAKKGSWLETQQVSNGRTFMSVVHKLFDHTEVIGGKLPDTTMSWMSGCSVPHRWVGIGRLELPPMAQEAGHKIQVINQDLQNKLCTVLVTPSSLRVKMVGTQVNWVVIPALDMRALGATLKMLGASFYKVYVSMGRTPYIWFQRVTEKESINCVHRSVMANLCAMMNNVIRRLLFRNFELYLRNGEQIYLYLLKCQVTTTTAKVICDPIDMELMRLRWTPVDSHHKEEVGDYWSEFDIDEPREVV